jgi:hypothetical protein
MALLGRSEVLVADDSSENKVSYYQLITLRLADHHVNLFP